MTIQDFEIRLRNNGGADREFDAWKFLDIHQIPVVFSQQDEIDFYCSDGKSVYLLRLRHRDKQKFIITGGTAFGHPTYLIAELPIAKVDNAFLKMVLSNFNLGDDGKDGPAFVTTEFATQELSQHSVLRHFPTLLKRWKGKQFRLVNLTESHRSIAIRLSGNRYNHTLPCLIISCGGPISMKGNFDMDTNDLEVKQVGENYIVYDKQNNFELVCEGVEIAECR